MVGVDGSSPFERTILVLLYHSGIIVPFWYYCTILVLLYHSGIVVPFWYCCTILLLLLGCVFIRHVFQAACFFTRIFYPDWFLPNVVVTLRS